MLSNYPVWNIKFVHYLDDLQIQIFFLKDKIDIWRKPHGKEKCKANSGEGKIIQTKSVIKLCEWDLGNDAVVFLFPKVFLAGPLLGCLPREYLGLMR